VTYSELKIAESGGRAYESYRSVPRGFIRYGGVPATPLS